MKRLIVIVIVSAALIGILCWAISCSATSKPKKSPVISEVALSLSETKSNLRKMMIPEFREIFDSNVQEDPRKILACVERVMGDKINELDLSGDRTDQTIQKIYSNNRDMYNSLAKCGFLDIMGKTVATLVWLMTHPKATPQQMQNMYDRLRSVDMSDINTWVNPGNSRGAIGMAIA